MDLHKLHCLGTIQSACNEDPHQEQAPLVKTPSSSILMNRSTARNCCGYCGATSYHRVLARDDAGVMRYTEALRCTGCGREYANLQVWRQGDTQESVTPPVATAH